MKFKFGSILVSAAFLAAGLTSAHAQDYPNGPVTVVVGYAAGGAADSAARFFSQKLEERLGVPFVVENTTGAGGLVGAARVAQSAPDGQTLMYTAQSVMAVGPIYNPDAPVIPHEELIGVASTTSKPGYLVVHPDAPFSSVEELVAYAKENPGRLTYGSGGLGTSPHLSGTAFADATGIEIRHITYGGENPAVLDVMGARLDLVFASAGAVMPNVADGKLKVLAVTSPERMADYPEVPTVAESGYEGFSTASWAGYVAPNGTPIEFRTVIADAVREILELPETKAFLTADGSVALVNTPDEFDAFIDEQAETWRAALADTVEGN